MAFNRDSAQNRAMNEKYSRIKVVRLSVFNQVLGGWGRVQKIKNEKESKRVLKQTKNEETLFIHMKVLKLKRNS